VNTSSRTLAILAALLTISLPGGISYLSRPDRPGNLRTFLPPRSTAAVRSVSTLPAAATSDRGPDAFDAWLLESAGRVPEVRSYREALRCIPSLVALEESIRVATHGEIERLVEGLGPMGGDVKPHLVVMALAGVRLEAALGGLRRLFYESRSTAFRQAILYGVTRRQPDDRHFESNRKQAWLCRIHRFARREVDDLSELYEGRYPDEAESFELHRGVLLIHDRLGRPFEVKSGLPVLLADEWTARPEPELRAFLREVLEQDLPEELLSCAIAPLRDNQDPAEEDADFLVSLAERPGMSELLRRQSEIAHPLSSSRFRNAKIRGMRVAGRRIFAITEPVPPPTSIPVPPRTRATFWSAFRARTGRASGSSSSKARSAGSGGSTHGAGIEP
jgi:hypothetical protein